jgi:hypothetical protein
MGHFHFLPLSSRWDQPFSSSFLEPGAGVDFGVLIISPLPFFKAQAAR